MDTSHHPGAKRLGFIVFWGVFWALGAWADNPRPPAAADDYELQRLLTPSPIQLATEGEGRVYIYDSLDMRQVDAALDRHFDRIEHMMFTRIHHLPPSGAGPAVVEDDGCD